MIPTDRYTKFPLMVAARQGQHGAVKFLLDRGTPVDLVDTSGQTCLHLAITGPGGADDECNMRNCLETVKCILEVSLMTSLSVQWFVGSGSGIQS